MTDKQVAWAIAKQAGAITFKTTIMGEDQFDAYAESAQALLQDEAIQNIVKSKTKDLLNKELQKLIDLDKQHKSKKVLILLI